MAIYHFSAKVIQRSQGRSAVAAAAYRSASELEDERLGQSHDFTAKAGVVYSEIMLPEGAPDRWLDRSALWNEVEVIERRHDAVLAREVEAEWRLIRAELDRILVRKGDLPAFHEISSEVRSISSDQNWKTFFLCGYGIKSEEAIRQCPETWRILQKIPGLKSAMFSIFEPGKHLPPHRGPYNGVLRFHLGLIVPDQPGSRSRASCR